MNEFYCEHIQDDTTIEKCSMICDKENCELFGKICEQLEQNNSTK